MSKDHLSIGTFRKLSTANKKISNKNRQKIKQKIFIHATLRHAPSSYHLTWSQSSMKAALFSPSEDFNRWVLEVAGSLDFLRPNFDNRPPEAARLGEDALRWEELLRLDTSNMEAEMEDTWLVSRAMVSGFIWLMSRTSATKLARFSMS